MEAIKYCPHCGTKQKLEAEACPECGGRFAEALTLREKCQWCGAGNPEGTEHCQICGARLLIYCPRCGTKSRAGLDFCPHCGFSYYLLAKEKIEEIYDEDKAKKGVPIGRIPLLGRRSTELIVLALVALITVGLIILLSILLRSLAA